MGQVIFAAEQIRVVELDGLQTQIGLVSEEQREAIHEDLLEAGELLTVDPARIPVLESLALRRKWNLQSLSNASTFQRGRSQ